MAVVTVIARSSFTDSTGIERGLGSTWSLDNTDPSYTPLVNAGVIDVAANWTLITSTQDGIRQLVPAAKASALASAASTLQAAGIDVKDGFGMGSGNVDLIDAKERP